MNFAYRIVSVILSLVIVHAPLAASAAIRMPQSPLTPNTQKHGFGVPYARPAAASRIAESRLRSLVVRQSAIVPVARITPPPIDVVTDWRRAARDPLAIRLASAHGILPERSVIGGVAVLPRISANTNISAHNAHAPTTAPRARPLAAVPAIPTTGIEKWWTYDTGSLPGVGAYAVNLANSNLIVTASDMGIPHRGVPFSFQRTYNSQSLHDTNGSDGGPVALFGNRWTNTFDSYLALNANGTISVYDDSGARMDYTSTTSPSYPTGWMPPAGIHAQLSHNADNSYDWTTKDGVIHRYWAPPGSTCTAASACGRLQYIIGRNHYTSLEFVYTYSNANRAIGSLLSILVIADDDTASKPDRVKLVASSASGVPLIVGLVWPDGATTITFKYDANDALDAVYEPGNNNVSVAQGYTTVGGLLEIVTDPRYNNEPQVTPCGGGNQVQFFWSSSNQVTGVMYLGLVNFVPPNDGVGGLLQANEPTGCNPVLETYYTFDPGVSARVSDTDGHDTFYNLDSLGRENFEIAFNSTMEYRQSQTWDLSNNVATVTDPRNNVTAFAHDANGNTTAVSEPISASSSSQTHPTSLFTYDANNNLLADCEPVTNAANGRTWSGAGAPPTCPLQTGGGVARFVWNTSNSYKGVLYEPYGELTDTYSRTGYHKQIGYNPYGQGASDFGEPTSVSGAAVQQFDGSTITPTLGIAYDSRGNVISYNVGTGNWYFTYDNLNRMSTVEDPDGIYGYSYWYPNGQCSGTETMLQHGLEHTQPGSARVTYAYDQDGDLTQETHHYGGVAGVTQRWYDGLDRLVEVSLPSDSTDAYATPAHATPWLTRYDYDLSAGNTVTLAAPSGQAVTLRAFGNLFGVQIYVPPVTGAAVTGWVNLRGYAYDAVDRTTEMLTTAPSAAGVGWSATVARYDSSLQTRGLLSSVTDALAHTASFAYDGDARPTAVVYNDGTPSKAVTYTLAGNVATAISGTQGTESYSYDLNGQLASYTEPGASANVTSPATISYGTYADGSSASVSVASAALNVANLFQYIHRVDGQTTAMKVNYPADGRASQSFSWAYTGAGRPTGAGDNIRPNAYAAQNNLLNGELTSYSIPAGQYSGLSYDPEGELLGYTAYSVGPNNSLVNVAYRYNVRGELVGRSTSPGTPFLPNFIDHSMQGFDLSDPTNGAAQPANITYDPANGAKLSQYLGSTTMYGAAGSVSSSWAYDGIGRQIGRTDVSQGGYNATVSMTRSYDGDDHLIANSCTPTPVCKGAGALSYGWTASGNLQTMVGDASRATVAGYGAAAKETLHWSNGQVLFTTNAAGKIDDLKIGTLADITNVANGTTSKPGLTIWDREYDGRQTSYHSSTGDGPWYPPVADPAGGYNLSDKDARGVLFVQENRTDGITDDTNVFQGDRVFDATLGTWTTPDPYGGDINNPATLKAYLYDNNNSQAYQDGSGNDPALIGSVLANPAVTSNPVGIIVGAVTAIVTFFHLFGGGGGAGHPAPPQARPQDPGVYVPQSASSFGIGCKYSVSLCTPTTDPLSSDQIDFTIIVAAFLLDLEPIAGPSIYRIIGRVRAKSLNEGIYEFHSSSGLCYVGQSCDISRRLTAHVRSGKLLPADLSTVSRTEVLGGKTAREIAEQIRIIQLGGIDNLENKINPIGPNRANLLPGWARATLKY